MTSKRPNPNGNLEVVLQGGLGNQLFQFFAALYYSKDVDLRINVNISEYTKNKSSGLIKRGFALPQFKYLPTYSIVESKRRLNCTRWRRFFVGSQKVSARVTDCSQSLNVVGDNVKLQGFFQESRFVTAFQSDIIKWLSLDSEQLMRLISLENQFQFQNNVLIHLRLGDYLLLDDFPILSEHTLERILSRLKQLDPSIGNCYIVTDSQDDHKKLYRNLIASHNVKLIKTQDVEPAVIIHLLASAQNLILSKSSLSWWGGYLSTLRGNKVFYPSCIKIRERGCFQSNLALPEWVSFKELLTHE